MAQAYVSTRVVTPQGTVYAAIFVEAGKILGVRPRGALGSSSIAPEDVHDFGDLAILPGLVDTHVHINEPGRTEWEGFYTATRAAAAGGYTTLIDMPLNCLPETTTVAALETKRAAASGQCFVDWMSWGGAVAYNQNDILPLAAAGVPGFKCFLIYPGCDGFTEIDERQLEAALPKIVATGLPLLVHAELAWPIEKAAKELRGADWRRYSTYLASRPDEAELEAIRLMIRLCRQYGFRLHIVHLATALALEELQAARDEGLPITVESCPHYLHFAAEEIPDGATLYKCAPPIRGRLNREMLWGGLERGTIDMIVTDHSPCPPEMKRLEASDADAGRFDLAWGGIASLSVALPVVWTECRRRGFTLNELARWTSSAPAALAGIADQAGALAAGRDANFTIFNPEGSFLVREDALHFRHRVSPYVGERLDGIVHATYVRGEVVFHNGNFTPTPFGRELALS